MSEQAIGALGLGKAASKLRSRSRDHSPDDYRHSDRDYNYRGHRRHDDRESGSRRKSDHHRKNQPSRSHNDSRTREDSSKELRNSLTAALTAGAAEAYRARKDPGGWNGDKGKRILTAAVNAGGVETLLDRHGSSSDKHSKRHLIESTLAGLAANHVVNGSRQKSRSRTGRRSRSGHGGTSKEAAAALLAAAGKKAYDQYRSRSRGRPKHSGYSSDDDDDDDDTRIPRRRRGDKKRSQSVSGYLNQGLAALGLDGNHNRSSKHYDTSSDESSPPRRSNRRRR